MEYLYVLRSVELHKHEQLPSANGETYEYSDEDMRNGRSSSTSSQDGRIVAVIGGRNYNFGNYSYATSKQQPGSSV